MYDAWDLGADIPPELLQSFAEPLPGRYSPLVSFDLNIKLQKDMCFLCRSLKVREVGVIMPDTTLEEYCGVHHPTTTCQRFSNHIEKCFELMKGQLDGDADGRRTYSGFIWSVLNDKLLSDTTQYCWDLDPRSEHYVLNLGGLEEHITRVSAVPITAVAKHQLFIIQFRNDVLLS